MEAFYGIENLPRFERAAVTIGSFDGVHQGHRAILSRVKKLADALGGPSVAITFDPHPRQILRPDDLDFRLLTSTAEKIELLEEAGISAVVVVPFSKSFSEQSPSQYLSDFLWKKFRPAAIVIGYDHRFGAGRKGDIVFLKENAPKFGFEVVEIPKQEIEEIAVSSTKIRRAIETGDLPTAVKMLGHAYSMSGTVVEGEKIGRSIGFPTANLFIEEKEKLLPPDGIYAAWARLENLEKPIGAMLYIGSRPTLDGFSERRIEANLLDFSEDIYGKRLRIEPVLKIRDDRKLEGLDALKAQIAADQIEIERALGLRADAAQSSKKMGLKTAIVILNYNTRRHLERFLPSVERCLAPGCEIIVADNASPDDSVDFLKKNWPQIRLIQLPANHGFAGGYNEALAQIEGFDLFCLLNSDVEVAENWIEPIVAAFETDERLAVAQPKILAFNDPRRFEHAGAAGGWIDFLGYPFCRGRIFQHCELDEGQYDAPGAHECFWAAGAAMFVRADLFKNLGGFDADYFAHNEEIDFCWRAKRAGWKVVCLTESRVWHLGGGTLDYESPRKVFLNFRNSLYSILKNEPLSKAIWAIPARLILDGAAGGMFMMKGRFASVKAIIEAHFSFYKNFGKIARKRALMQRRVVDFSIRENNSERTGVYRKSIVWEFYFRGIKRFSKL